jgi:hypothetical protein
MLKFTAHRRGRHHCSTAVSFLSSFIKRRIGLQPIQKPASSRGRAIDVGQALRFENGSLLSLDTAPDIWTVDLPQLIKHLCCSRRGIDDRIDQQRLERNLLRTAHGCLHGQLLDARLH